MIILSEKDKKGTPKKDEPKASIPDQYKPDVKSYKVILEKADKTEDKKDKD